MTETSFGKELKNKLLEGVRKLNNSVASTLGPAGRTVLIKEENGEIKVTKDGVTVAKAFKEFPEIKFQYVGVSDNKTREVCQRALQEPPLTIEEINALGYVDFGSRGGYNCRHDWIRV